MNGVLNSIFLEEVEYKVKKKKDVRDGGKTQRTKDPKEYCIFT
jgi:hypothetical protein